MEGLLWFILIGLAAGWLAGQFVKGAGSGVLRNLIIGVIGAVVGGFLFRLLGLAAVGFPGQLVVSTVGAVTLLLGLRWLKRQ